MTFKKVDTETYTMQPFKEIGKDWLLISAKKEGVVNTMTASWGGIGVLWKRNVATVYIRPQRYTKEFVDGAEYFTLTMFDSHKKELGILGSKSGRDIDKIKEVDFHLEEIDGQPTFAEGKATLVCKKLYADTIKAECFIEPGIDEDVYPNKDYHVMYIGEIVGVYVNEKG